MAVNLGARMWTPFKELHHTVEAAVLRKQPDAIQDLDKILKKHKPDFLSLLQNPAKNKVHRESVKRADKEGIAIQGQQATQTLSRDFIDEALIISDLFDLNEYAAVELLLAGENQLPYFPGLTRGLVSVVLYYDGRTSMVNSLRTLIQAREGRTFTLGLSEDLVSTATKFTDQLMAEGLTSKILDLLRVIDETKELNRLQQERGLGNAKHRKQVSDLLREVRQSLADCLFCWACQTPLSREDTLHLLNYVRKNDGLKADGTLDQVSMTLLMALLYCLDVRMLEQEDSDEVIQKLPIVADDQYIPDLQREIVSMHQWTNPGLKAVVQFTWAITLRAVSQNSNAQDTKLIKSVSEYCEQDERIIDNAIEENVFFTLRDCIIKSSIFHKEEFFVRQIHNIVADFIVQMPLKIKELRNRGDETARIIIAHAQEGLEAPGNLRRDFEQFLMMIGDLYNKDPLNLELAVEYWCPPDPSLSGMGSFNTSYNYRPPNRQISLYKFVRHAGDLLPPSLYIPYIQMLTGLANGQQCAHHCYNLLKTNGGQAGTVSWDHFFTSMNQYYNNLRQEVPVASDMAHVYRHQIRGITPQEVEGLCVVLKLTRVIAEQDEAARVALCDNQHWLPVVVLLGLISCSVPPLLKAELLLTLAAFAKSPEISASLWQSIEVSQILPTLPSQSMHQPGGIQVELDEVEARNEEFPMTLGFLELMKVLTESPVPAALGAGYRAPGFDPYLNFLRDSIFLKFNTRAYKNFGERWDVGSSVLEVFYKLLVQHEVVPEDFIDQTVDVQGGGTVLANKSPGHNLMVHLLNDTSLLKMILYIMDEATRLLDSFISFPGKDELENASLLCLKILDLVFAKQEDFLAMLRDSGASFIVSPMESLLLGINPRSGRPDHILNAAKYVTYNSHLPEHSLYAVKILCCVAQGQGDLVGLFTAQQAVAGELLNGFVECLEVEEPEEIDPDTQDEELISSAQIRNATRQSILQLLLQTLDQQAPNLAHFLLGFETRKPVTKTNLQDPGIKDGVLGSPRTCLHSVLTLLDRGVGGRFGPSCLYETPRLAELSYQLLYVLSANKDTSGPTLRYLRTAHDFLYRHLQHVPFQLQDMGKTIATDNNLLNQQSWLLKCVAIELRTLAVNRQRSHTQRLITLLLDDNPSPAHKTQPDGIYEPEFSQFDQDFFGVSSYMNIQQSITGGQIRRKLLSILDSISLCQTYPEAIQLEFFDPAAVDRLIEQKSAPGGFCNVKVLHKSLMTELNNIQGASAGIGQRQVIVGEINAICANVVERNACRESLTSKKRAFESWRQIVEVAITACPDDLLQGESRQNVIFELLQDLLIKVADEEAVPELTALIAGVVLTLLCNLRHCFLTDQSEIAQLQDISHYITLLDAGDKPVMADQSTFDQGTGSRTLYSSSLQVVLKGLIDYILKSSSGLQRVRANLYGALLYYLQIAQKPSSLQVINSALIHEKSVGAMLSSKDSEFERLTKENMSTIGAYGDNLMQIVCRDACDGHNVGRMLALGVLDSMLTFDVTQQWLTYMSSKGFVQHIVDSLLQDDDELQAMLSPQPAPLKALYIYQSKMGLLTRVAESATGAQTLLGCGLMTRLAECTVFDMRPDADRPGELSFIPTVMSRYRQLLLPALKLCLAVLTSLGIENRTSSHQVLQFVIGHVDVFGSILRDRQTDLSLASLQELAITTSVLSRCAAHDVEEDMIGSTADIEYRGHLARIQRQMVALLPRYCLSDKLLKQVRNINMETESSRESRETQSDMIVAIEEIASNVIAFCRSVVSKSGTSAQFSKLLFGPSLMEATSRDFHSLDDLQSSVSTVSRPPNLGVVVYMLRQCTNQFLTTYEAHKHSMRKLDSVAALSAEELNELCGGQSAEEKLSSQQKHSIARRRLLQIISSYTQQLQLLSYIIENCLFILWRHLEFYLVHCVPSDTGASLFHLHTKKQHPLRRLQDMSGVGHDHSLMDESSSHMSSGVSSDELDQLKHDTRTCINDSLFKKLHEIEQCYAKKRTRYGFLEALVRRLKRLVKIQLTQSS